MVIAAAWIVAFLLDVYAVSAGARPLGVLCTLVMIALCARGIREEVRR